MGASVLQYVAALERWLQSVIPIFTILQVLGGLMVAGGGLWLLEAIVIPKDEYRQKRDQTMAELKELEAKLDTWSKMSEEEKEEYLAKQEERERRRQSGGLTHNPLGRRDVLGKGAELVVEEVEAAAKEP
eukprot:CAMPEP_0205929978 /NCGR_PEP_ID=MMETSP1325-20131115/25618_1 /ASSEMBLY_ACC=CAM_ASM_000708 /TAXON_ID=236786 /ORGANISM="Florenciella sp., Strain RCC1007" /LENGTH=129 /DNA_ID=CAMNT_0053299269 /DNA_START=78 /DNA_END=463 /DNA_ORIENTATION=+